MGFRVLVVQRSMLERCFVSFVSIFVSDSSSHQLELSVWHRSYLTRTHRSVIAGYTSYAPPSGPIVHTEPGPYCTVCRKHSIKSWTPPIFKKGGGGTMRRRVRKRRKKKLHFHLPAMKSRATGISEHTPFVHTVWVISIKMVRMRTAQRRILLAVDPCASWEVGGDAWESPMMMGLERTRTAASGGRVQVE